MHDLPQRLLSAASFVLLAPILFAQGRQVRRVTPEKAGPEDRYGDIFVDTDKSHEIYKEWLAMTRPAPGPDGLRRPLWFDRPLRPIPDAYTV